MAHELTPIPSASFLQSKKVIDREFPAKSQPSPAIGMGFI